MLDGFRKASLPEPRVVAEDFAQWLAVRPEPNVAHWLKSTVKLSAFFRLLWLESGESDPDA